MMEYIADPANYKQVCAIAGCIIVLCASISIWLVSEDDDEKPMP